ncbi:hypothetical protein SI65_04229 [Aspergillus cristatus]|uniref:Ankyrin repeat protein n=1 Tax=Aspergillus cristatus TaxID=573508 RepID=A0A1E3BLB1_ASPCR|nr:hypothetical protein SI65_04229 [Aspergillus cristatus]
MDHPLIKNYPHPTHMQSMLQACASNNLPALQALLKPYNYHPTGTSLIWCESDTDPPETWKMVTIAITHGHIHILSYLLTLYSRGGGIECYPIIEAILDNPDVEMMRLVHNHSPRSIHYIFDSGETFLSMACRRCQYRSHSDNFMARMLALVHYLLDNGASPAEHVYEQRFRGDGALLPAVRSRLPIDVIEKMVKCGAVVDVEVFGEAVGGRRVDVLGLFLRKGKFGDGVGGNLKGLCDVARERGNGDVDGVVVGFVERGVRRRVWRDRCLRVLCFLEVE